MLVVAPYPMLAEALEQEVDSISAVKVCITSKMNLGLLAEIQIVKPEVVIVFGSSDEQPGIVSHVFDAYPGIVVAVFDEETHNVEIFKKEISNERVACSDWSELLSILKESQTQNYWGPVC